MSPNSINLPLYKSTDSDIVKAFINISKEIGINEGQVDCTFLFTAQHQHPISTPLDQIESNETLSNLLSINGSLLFKILGSFRGFNGIQIEITTDGGSRTAHVHIPQKMESAKIPLFLKAVHNNLNTFDKAEFRFIRLKRTL